MYRTPWTCTEFTTLQPLCTRLRSVENSKVIYRKKLVCLDRILGFMPALKRPGEAPCRRPSSSIGCWCGQVRRWPYQVTNVCTPQSKLILHKSTEIASFWPQAENRYRKWDIKRKIGVTECPRSLNPGKAIAMAICPIIFSFYFLARALMNDVVCEFACAVGMRRNN